MGNMDTTVVAVTGLLVSVAITIAICVTVAVVSEHRQEVQMAQLGFTPADVNYSNTWVKLELEEGE